MITVKIAYDPYHMKTSLNINGRNVKRVVGEYERIRDFAKQDIPLQSWIDPIPYQDDWKGLLWEVLGTSNESKVEFHFRGRKIDFLDLKESMLAQSENGKYKVEVTFPEEKQAFCYDDQVILERAKKAYELIQSDYFKQILDDKLFEIGEDSTLYTAYQTLEERYKAAMDGEFRIVFSGMYTCGKSTVINAILGKDILPTCDGTCTSKIFKIYHDPTVEFAKMSCLDSNGNVVIEECEYDAVSLSKKFDSIFPRKDNKPLPSVPPTIETVRILTNMKTLYPDDAPYSSEEIKIVIIDTPGTDSGEGNALEGKQSHVAITEEVLSSESKEIVVMATNAKEDKNKSIQEFLDMVDKHSSGTSYDQRFLFVLNQADLCNFDKPSDAWDERFRGIQDYYNGEQAKQRSIQNPRFFPTSALAALEIRTDRTDSAKYRSIEQKYYTENRKTRQYKKAEGEENFHFDEVCSTSQAIKDKIADELSKLENDEINEFDRMAKEIELHSGIISLEMAICDYIEKYAFPLKIQDLLRSYEIIFKETNQLLNIASVRFDKAVKARENADANKSLEEEKKAEAEEVGKSLVRVEETIKGHKTSLDRIYCDFRKKVDGETVDIRAKLEEDIAETLKSAKENAKNANIKKEIQTSIDNTIISCQTQVEKHFSESRAETHKLETDIQVFWGKIRTIIDFGTDFSIENTIDFAEISTDSIAQVHNKKRRNPELDKGFFLWRPIKNLFIKREIDEGIDLDELTIALYDIRDSVNHEIDRTLGESLNSLKDATEHLKRNMDKLNVKIKEQAKQLAMIEKNIERMVSDTSEKVALEQKFREFKNILSEIQTYTYFDEINEE